MNDFPEVVNAVRLTTRQRELVSYQDNQFWEEQFMLADPSIFDLFTFPLLKGNPAAELESKFPDFIGRYFSEEDKNQNKFHLQPLTEIHLHSQLRSDLPTNRDISQIYIFSGITFIILLIACIDYMNLATARFAGRAKEVGMRKVVGAQRTQLIVQFIGESILLSFIALTLALILVKVFLPTFNQLANKNLQFKSFANLSTLAGLAGITLFVGLVAGSYPALFLSASKPIRVLTSGSQAGE